MTGRKKLVADITIRVVLEVNDDYDEHDVDFWLNESSWCRTNPIAELIESIAESDEKGVCNICYRSRGEFVRWMEPGEDEVKAVSM